MAQIAQREDVSKTSGWAVFAGSLMVLAAAFHVIAGFVALFEPDLYVSTESGLWMFNYDQWGWTHILIGLILVFSAVSLFSGHLWGRIVAITIAGLSAIANFGFIWAYPVWSIVIIVLDVLIIYNVATMGRREEE